MYHKMQSIGLGWKCVWCVRFNSFRTCGTWRAFLVRHRHRGLSQASLPAPRVPSDPLAPGAPAELEKGQKGEKVKVGRAGLFCFLEDLHIMKQHGKIKFHQIEGYTCTSCILVKLQVVTLCQMCASVCFIFVVAMCKGKIATQAWELSLTFTPA